MATKKTARKKTASERRTTVKAARSASQPDARRRGRSVASKDGKRASVPAGASARTKTPAKTKAEPRRTGVLDAATAVLAEAPEPMSCGEMIEAILRRRLWTTQGKTPAATLSSAILREIRNKGKQSRFVKAERGRFKRSKAS